MECQPKPCAHCPVRKSNLAHTLSCMYNGMEINWDEHTDGVPCHRTLRKNVPKGTTMADFHKYCHGAALLNKERDTSMYDAQYQKVVSELPLTYRNVIISLSTFKKLGIVSIAALKLDHAFLDFKKTEGLD